MKKIAIIKIGALGDVVRSTAILKALHRENPNVQIWWFTAKSAAPLLANNPFIHEVLTMDQIADSVYSIPFELVISLDEELPAATLASQLNKQNLIGVYLNNDQKIVYTESGAPWFGMGLLNRDADGGLKTANHLKAINTKTYPEILFQMCGLTVRSQEDTEPLIFEQKEAALWAQQYLETKNISKPIIGLNLGSGQKWKSKQLTLERALKLFEEINTTVPCHLMLLGGSEEKERNKLLLAKSTVPLIDSGTDNSLAQFVSLIHACSLIITSDSLALHIASALKKKLVVFFGPTSSTEIPLFDRGINWLPKHACACFYLSQCRVNEFCLDSLNFSDISTYVKANCH